MKTVFALFGAIAIFAITTAAPASAASVQDEFAAATDGGKLPPCPSMFRCSVR
jgi:hypothetical protein